MDPDYTLWRMVGDLLEVTCPSDAGEALCVSQKNTAAASIALWKFNCLLRKITVFTK
jgi:hypothetical protein